MTDDESKQAKGGRARAEKLTRAQRSEIARKAAVARWREGEPIEATHVGTIKLGDMELACANLPDGRRVVSEAALLGALGRNYSGYYSKRAAAEGTTGPEDALRFFEPKMLKPYVPEELRGLKPIPYTPPMSATVMKGVDAESIPGICEVWLDAREAGVLSDAQEKQAAKAEIIIRGLARTGIIALIDEATGYQYERQRDALQELLEKFLSEGLRRWVKTFPDGYFRELCRLRRIPYRPDMKFPQYFGHLTRDIVYQRLHPDVLEALDKLNPSEGGRRKNAHHQWLSGDVGHPELLKHLGAVVGLMKISDTYEVFKERLDVVAPSYKDVPLLAQMASDG